MVLEVARYLGGLLQPLEYLGNGTHSQEQVERVEEPVVVVVVVEMQEVAGPTEMEVAEVHGQLAG